MSCKQFSNSIFFFFNWISGLLISPCFVSSCSHGRVTKLRAIQHMILQWTVFIASRITYLEMLISPGSPWEVRSRGKDSGRARSRYIVLLGKTLYPLSSSFSTHKAINGTDRTGGEIWRNCPSGEYNNPTIN